MSGCVRHAWTAIGWTEATLRTREGVAPIVAALVAVNTQEAAGEHSALEIGPDLPLDEASDRSARRSGAFEERLKVLAHHAMKERLLRLVAFVTNRGGFAGTEVESNSPSNRHADQALARRFGSNNRLRNPSLGPRRILPGAVTLRSLRLRERAATGRHSGATRSTPTSRVQPQRLRLRGLAWALRRRPRSSGSSCS